MGGKVSILGYPSKTAAAVALRDVGHDPAMIAARFDDGTTPIQIRNLLYYADTRGREGIIRVYISDRLTLEQQADTWGMTPRTLCEKILEVALRDDLISAILDEVAA